MLADFGFEFPLLAGMSAREQVETIVGAEMVVYAAGARCVLAHFAPEHCTSLLLAPRNIGTGFWGGVDSALVQRQVYERVDCDLVETPGAVRLNMYGNNELADFSVNIDLMRAGVEMCPQRLQNAQRRDALAL